MPRAIWNVRVNPARVIRSGRHPVMVRPAKVTRPPPGRTTPLMH